MDSPEQHRTTSSGPAETVLAALAARSARDWRRLVSFADPASVRRWRDAYVGSNTHVPTVAELARDHPTAPRAALAHAIEQDFAPKRRDFEARLPGLVAGVRTIAELEALSAAECLARFLEAHDGYGRVLRLAAEAYAAAGRPLPAAWLRPPPAAQFRVVTEDITRRGEARVTFVAVEPATAADAGDPATWRLRRVGAGDWRIVVDTDFLDAPGAVAWIVGDDPVVGAYLERLRRPFGLDERAG